MVLESRQERQQTQSQARLRDFLVQETCKWCFCVERRPLLWTRGLWPGTSAGKYNVFHQERLLLLWDSWASGWEGLVQRYAGEGFVGVIMAWTIDVETQQTCTCGASETHQTSTFFVVLACRSKCNSRHLSRGQVAPQTESKKTVAH